MVKKNLFLSALMATLNSTRASVRDDEKQLERLNRAFGICQRTEGIQGYMRSHEHEIHIVDGSLECTCPDFKYRYSRKRGTYGPCKHILALKLYLTAFLKSNGVKEARFDFATATATLWWDMFSYGANQNICINGKIRLERLLNFQPDMLKAWMAEESAASVRMLDILLED